MHVDILFVCLFNFYIYLLKRCRLTSHSIFLLILVLLDVACSLSVIIFFVPLTPHLLLFKKFPLEQPTDCEKFSSGKVLCISFADVSSRLSSQKTTHYKHKIVDIAKHFVLKYFVPIHVFFPHFFFFFSSMSQYYFFSIKFNTAKQNRGKTPFKNDLKYQTFFFVISLCST